MRQNRDRDHLRCLWRGLYRVLKVLKSSAKIRAERGDMWFIRERGRAQGDGGGKRAMGQGTHGIDTATKDSAKPASRP